MIRARTARGADGFVHRRPSSIEFSLTLPSANSSLHFSSLCQVAGLTEQITPITAIHLQKSLTIPPRPWRLLRTGFSEATRSPLIAPESAHRRQSSLESKCHPPTSCNLEVLKSIPLPTTRFLFWNINRKPLVSAVAELADIHRTDVVVLAECPRTWKGPADTQQPWTRRISLSAGP